MMNVCFHRRLDQIDAQHLGQRFFWELRTAHPVENHVQLREQHCRLRGLNGQYTLGRVAFLYNGSRLIACSSVVRTLFNHSVMSVVSLNDFNVKILPAEDFMAMAHALVPDETSWQIEKTLHAIVDFNDCDVGVLCTYWCGNEVLGQVIAVMPTQTESGMVVQLLSEDLVISP